MITLNPKYQALFVNDTRFYIITGGRGSQKSFAVGTFSNLLSFEAGHKILFTRQTMTSAHLSIIPEFVEKISLMNLEHFFEISKTEIRNIASGVDTIFRGIKTGSGDQTANLKSLQGVTTWILDEAEEQKDENTFDKINLSVRQKGVHNRVIIILNPTTKEHFIYKRFFESAGVNAGFNGIKDNVTYIHTTYLDNIENLDQSFIDECERMKRENPEKFNHVIMGGWLDKSEGVIFSNWEVGEYFKSDYEAFGQDYGFSVDPTTLIQCSVNKSEKKIFVKEHLYKPGMVTSEIALFNTSVAGKSLIVADSAEPRLIAELKSKGNNMRAISKPAIIDRIALLQDYKIIVDPDSLNIIRELNNYVWHDKKSETPVDMYNHTLDPIGYVLWDAVGAPRPKIRSASTISFKDFYK